MALKEVVGHPHPETGTLKEGNKRGKGSQKFFRGKRRRVPQNTISAYGSDGPNAQKGLEIHPT